MLSFVQPPLEDVYELPGPPLQKLHGQIFPTMVSVPQPLGSAVRLQPVYTGPTAIGDPFAYILPKATMVLITPPSV